MAGKKNILAEISAALVEQTSAMGRLAVAIESASGHGVSGTLWGPDVVVTSEQSLPTNDRYEVTVGESAVAEASKGAVDAGKSDVVGASAIGRDAGTNVAVLRLDRALPHASPETAEARVGAIALVIGADAAGSKRARFAVVNSVAPEWHSRAGGRIERRIVLDTRIARAEEGGPVIDANGSLLGMSTLGPRGQVLVIPTATLERIVPRLLQDGRVARGWLGIALHPVAVADNLREAAKQEGGMMVMSVFADGPAAKAGVAAGDILLALDGSPALGGLAAKLESESVGREVDLRLLRGGGVVTLRATVSARP
jgi:S1-C subfamily serine protease